APTRWGDGFTRVLSDRRVKDDFAPTCGGTTGFNPHEHLESKEKAPATSLAHRMGEGVCKTGEGHLHTAARQRDLTGFANSLQRCPAYGSHFDPSSFGNLRKTLARRGTHFPPRINVCMNRPTSPSCGPSCLLRGGNPGPRRGAHGALFCQRAPCRYGSVTQNGSQFPFESFDLFLDEECL